jgi:hypothetical protein
MSCGECRDESHESSTIGEREVFRRRRVGASAGREALCGERLRPINRVVHGGMPSLGIRRPQAGVGMSSLGREALCGERLRPINRVVHGAESRLWRAGRLRGFQRRGDFCSRKVL